MNASATAEYRMAPRLASSCQLSVEDGGLWQLKSAQGTLVVDPSRGARIVSFRTGNHEALTSPEVVAAGDANLQNMYGSTFWTSPQADWQWPPEVAVDSGPYEVVREPDGFSCTGQAGAITGYRVRKAFSFNATRGCFAVSYQLIGDATCRRAAPWEVSRVPKGGLVVFPATTTACEPSTTSTQVGDGVAWLDVDSVPGGDQKVFQDASEGWLAYLHGGVALIKTFPNIPRERQAPGEAEVEVFVSGSFGYVELEQQGAFDRPGAESWTVEWWLRRVPQGVLVAPGSSALVDWIRRVISGDEK